MKKIAFIVGCLAATSAHAQSTGIPWVNGRVLTAPMLQTLDQAKMNINSLGKPGFAPQLNSLGQITNPVVGDVSQAKATSDGQTVVQVTAKAANAVQKSDVGATVAPLDANKMMPAPVSGDTSQASVTAQSLNITTTGATLNRAVADNAYVHSLGATNVGADGTVSPTALHALIASAVRPFSLRLSSGEHLPAGQASEISQPDATLNSVMVTSDGQLLSPADESSTQANWNGGSLSRQVGEGVLAQAFEPKFGVMRDREYNDNGIYSYAKLRMPAPLSSDFFTNKAQWVTPSECSSGNGNSYWCDIGSWKTNVHYNLIKSTSNAGTNGNFTDFYSGGNGHWKSDDVGTWVRMHMSGTNWGWSSIREMIEEGGIAIGGYTDSTGTQQYPGFQRYISEWDTAGVGPDLPSSYYNPTLGLRKGLWLRAYNAGGMSWSASTPVPQYQILLASNSSGTVYMYENTASGATTGTTQPAWTFNETGPVTDGTASWVFLGTKKFQIGCAFCVGSDASDEFGALLSSNGTVYDAAIDLSPINYDAAIPVALRTRSNTYIDLSADATKGGQNNHLFGYGQYNGIGWGTLEYVVNGQLQWHLNDQGFVGTRVGTYTASGTTINDAISVNTPFSEISGASSDNAGLKMSVIGSGERFGLYNYSGHPIRIYPYNGGWHVNGASQFYTLQNGEWAEGYVASGNNLNIHSSQQVGSLTLVGSLYLGSMTKAAILAISSPVEGQTLYDTDDHAQVTYRCPTGAANSCAWFQVEYGAALSN